MQKFLNFEDKLSDEANSESKFNAEDRGFLGLDRAHCICDFFFGLWSCRLFTNPEQQLMERKNVNNPAILKHTAIVQYS